MSTHTTSPPAIDSDSAGPQRTPASPSMGAAPTSRTRRTRSRRLPGWLSWLRPGIQSKLLLMLLLTSVLSALVVGFIGYRSGRDALRASALQRLQNVRESRAVEVESYFSQLRDSLVIYTRGTTAVEAAKAFTAGFDALQKSAVTPTQQAALDRYYSDVFIKNLDANQATTSDPIGFEPTTPAQRYLQVHYTAPHADFDQALKVDDAKDGSAWSAAHAKYHDYFRELVSRFGYDDALILDTRGTVVYSAYKGVDLGTNVRTGPYRTTSLATAYQGALGSNAVDYVGFTDFGRYQPSYGVPTAWAVSPIGQNGVVSGVLALQIPSSQINKIMTGGGDWKAEGLGDTGETYLVGQDTLMRSTSRLVLQNPAEYEKEAVAAGLPPADAAKARRVKGTILIQTVRSNVAQQGLQGHTGETIAIDYLGRESLAAYAPLQFQGQTYAIVATIDSSEAFHPVSTFTRDIALATTAIIFIVCLASLLLAQVFVRPVRRLVTGVRQVAGGDYDARVDASSDDEFGELAGAFNDMGQSLRTKQDLIEQQQQENDRLLLNLMPEAVARRYREGEETISEEHQDVSVLYGDLQGFDALATGMNSADSLSILNDLVRMFDDAAGQLGVEKVRTLRSGYLASCGLTIPRVDNARRIVTFAQEMARIVERFNAQHGTALSIRAGIDNGPVTSGLVGRTSVVYDMWGDAVNLANRVQSIAGRPGIFVTQRVLDRLGDSGRFAEAGEIETQSGAQRVWQLEQVTT